MPQRIDFTDRHEQHPPSVKSYALEKVGRLERFFDGVNHVQIVLDRQHDKHSAEMIVTAAPNLRFVGHAAEKTVTEAIDSAIDKVERQVVKAKERLKDHRPGITSASPSLEHASPVVGLFSPKGIIPDLQSTTRDEALEEVVRDAVAAGVLPRTRRTQVLDALLERERRGSTGLGRGIAIPHAKIAGLRQHAGLVARSREGLDFRAIDGERVHVLVMLISPDARQEEHLATLRWVSGLARDPDFTSFIRQARTAEEIYEVLRERAG